MLSFYLKKAGNLLINCVYKYRTIVYNVLASSEGEQIMAVALREKRIEFRLPEDAKKVIEEAAELSNLSISSYILNVVYKQAKLDLEQNEMIVLNNAERDKLIKALSSSKEPNAKLKGLFR